MTIIMPSDTQEMSKQTIKIFSPSGQYIGYFTNPKIEFFPDSDYDFEGSFYDAAGELVSRIEYNPQALPYTAELDGMPDLKHTRLHTVYIQHARNPIKMSGHGE
jgi:hypothetical protein